MGMDVFVFPTKGYDEILFFQSKQEMLKSAAAQIAYKKKTAPPDCNSRGAVSCIRLPIGRSANVILGYYILVHLST